MRSGNAEPVLVFATSGKGGTGRSVTSGNIAYRLSLRGHDVAYAEWDHDRDAVLGSIRSIRTAVAPPEPTHTRDPVPAAGLQEQAKALRQLAVANGLGTAVLLGQRPIEPVLDWREQLILDADVNARIADRETTEAYTLLAERLTAGQTWDTE